MVCYLHFSLNLRKIQAKNFEIEAEQNIKWTIDGEFAGEEKNVKIENMQKKIELAIYQR